VVRVIVEHGVLQGEVVAWIGGVDASSHELEQLARSMGLGDHALARLAQRRRTRRVPGSRVTLLDQGAHLLFVGVGRDAAEAVRVHGHIEMLATRDAVVVLSTAVSERMEPAALRSALEPALAAAGIQPLGHALQELTDRPREGLEVTLAAALRSEVLHLAARLQRIDALLSSAQQTYFNLAQDHANTLMERQGDVTRRMSGYALLVAIPAIAFGLYGTNFDHIPLIGESWGYAVMLGLTCLVCGLVWWRLRAADWL
jgi:hypothetical protein